MKNIQLIFTILLIIACGTTRKNPYLNHHRPKAGKHYLHNNYNVLLKSDNHIIRHHKYE
jgi:hypothetical protein